MADEPISGESAEPGDVAGEELDSSPPAPARGAAVTALAVFVGAVLAVGLTAVLWKIRGIFLPFLIGLFVAYVLDPVLDFLERRGSSRRTAVWMVTIVFVALTTTLFVTVGPVVIHQLQSLYRELPGWGEEINALYEARKPALEQHLSRWLPEAPSGTTRLDALVQNVRDALTAKAPLLVQNALTLAQRTLAFGLLVLLVLLIAFHFMQVIDPFRQGLLKLVPERRQEYARVVSTEVSTMLGAYLRGLTLVCVLVALASTGLLYTLQAAFGMKYALLLGLVTGLTYAVPYVGATLSAVLSGVVGALTAEHDAIVCGLLAVGIQIAINQVFDNIVMPRIVGERVGLHPLAVIFALMAGYQIWGIIGMIVAVPVAASIKIVVMKAYPALERADAEVAAPRRRGISVGGEPLLPLLRRWLTPPWLRRERENAASSSAADPDEEQAQ
ncbi:MAG: AI-2E family transporter [Armatimonadota bacterium]